MSDPCESCSTYSICSFTFKYAQKTTERIPCSKSDNSVFFEVKKYQDNLSDPLYLETKANLEVESQ